MTEENKAFESAYQFTLSWEGGLSDHPADLGGLTKYGITQANYKKWRGRKSDSVRHITKEEADRYYREVWRSSDCDHFAWLEGKARGDDKSALASAHFDTAVNFGSWGATLFLAESLGLEIKQNNLKRKIFASVGKLSTPDQFKSLAIAICNGRIAYRHQRVEENSSQQVFLQGWLNRDRALLDFVKTL